MPRKRMEIKRPRAHLIGLRGNRTQEEIARLLGITQSYYARLESGDKVPSISLLARMTAVLGPAVLLDYGFPVSVLIPANVLPPSEQARSHH